MLRLLHVQQKYDLWVNGQGQIFLTICLVARIINISIHLLMEGIQVQHNDCLCGVNYNKGCFNSSSHILKTCLPLET